MAVRESPVSSMIESMNAENPKDWPGLELKTISAPTATITHP